VHSSIQIQSITKAALVDLDATSIGVAVLFLLLFFILNKLLHQPMLTMFEKRHGLTDGARADAKDAVGKAEEQMLTYEERLTETRREALAEQKALREEGRARERETIKEVRAQADAEIAQGIEELNKQAAVIGAELEKAAKDLGGQIALRVTGGGK